MPRVLLHLLAVSNGGPSLQRREIRYVDHHGADVQDAVESPGGAANLDSGEGGDPGTGSEGREEITCEETDGPDQMVAEVTDGVDLDADGGSFAGEEFWTDFEEELVIPGRIFSANPVCLGLDLVVRVDPDECVGLHAAQVSGGGFEILR